jgi:glycosyltransferase involved in cell wall biosynthesis
VLRIGIVTGEYPPHQGGVGDFSHEIALALADLGHEVHVITHKKAQPDSRLNLHAAIGNWNFWSLYQVRQIARSIPLDIVNIQYQAAAYNLGWPIHFLPNVVGVPSVVTFHDLRVPYLFPLAGAQRRRQAVYSLAARATGVIVTNSNDHFGLERTQQVRKIAEIPIGSNIKAFATHTGARNIDYGQRWGFTANDKVIGYFGFLNVSKGGKTLLQALAQLPGYRLLLIGGRTGTSDATNAKYAAEVDSLAANLGVAERIVRTGYLAPDDTTRAFLACDLMAMPYSDGVSLRRGSFMACLAHGMPTITTTPEFVFPGLGDQQNVYFVLPDDSDALARAIQHLSATPELRVRLANGAARLATEFTWDKIAQRTADFFERVLAAPTAEFHRGRRRRR